MSGADPNQTSAAPDGAVDAPSLDGLQPQIAATLAAIGEGVADEESFEHLLARVADLVKRKHSMEGCKHETRDLMSELVFARLRHGLEKLVTGGSAQEVIRAAEWTMGALFAQATLTEFACAIDRVLLESGGPRDFSFAGRTDFIRVEEVLQMLGSGKHKGCLSLEKPDNRLDIYLQDGHIAFLDPHKMVRRVMPSSDMMGHREIPEQVLLLADSERALRGTPLFLSLRDAEVFPAGELRRVVRRLGTEVFTEFLAEREGCSFFYRQVEDLPESIRAHDIHQGVTPMLLEASKQLDDWQLMLNVFPDPDAPVPTEPDMVARLGELNLGVNEIKLLANLGGGVSPRQLVATMGLPLYDIYELLVKLAREGVLIPPDGPRVLQDLSISSEESVQLAFEALDANDDALAVGNALERVLGGGEEPLGKPASGNAPTGGATTSEPSGTAGGSAGEEDLGADFIRSLRKKVEGS